MKQLLAIMIIGAVCSVVTGFAHAFVVSRPLRKHFVRRINEIGLLNALAELMN